MYTAYLFDNTGSMRQQLPRERELARELMRQAGAPARFSLFTFNPGMGTSRTAEPAKGADCAETETVDKQIDGLATVGGQTTLLDAIQLAATHLSVLTVNPCNNVATKFVVVISDGEDRASKASRSDVIELVKRAGIKVLAIGLLDDMSSDRGFVSKSPKEKGKEFLKGLANDSGGRAVFPKPKETAEETVRELLSKEPLKAGK